MVWMAQLPRDIQTPELAHVHPRIVNKLARLWRSALQVDACLHELIVDKRGTRLGFTTAIRDELLELRSHNNKRYTYTRQTVG